MDGAIVGNARIECSQRIDAAKRGRRSALLLPAGILAFALLTLAVVERGNSEETLSTPPPQVTPLSQSPPRDFSGLKSPSVPFQPGPVIPGLAEGAIPQGIAYVAAGDEDDAGRIVISHYMDDGPSRLSVIDRKSGKLVGSVLLKERAVLKESADKFHQGHVGGVTVLGRSLFVSSDEQILQYPVAPLLGEELPQVLTPTSVRKCETRASFCTATDDTLLVGEFAYGNKYPTDKSHHVTDRRGIKKRAWVCGYAANNLAGRPKFVISVRQRVQGMCVTDEAIYLSLSFGRRGRSTIVEYKNPLGGPAHAATKLTDGTEVPLWFLDGENYVREIDFPPMAEGIVMIGDRLAVLSESGAKKYQFAGRGPLDRVLLLDVGREK